MPEESAGKTKSDIGRFAIVPEWLLLSGVSGNAIKCFGVLCAMFVDRKTDDAHPSRKRMAGLVGCSESSYDRYLKELESVGAISIEQQWRDDGDQLPNNITVHYVQPCAGVSSPVGTPPSSPVSTPLCAGDEQSIIIDPESNNHIGKASPTKRKKGEFQALTSEQEATLKSLFPDVDVDIEIQKARAHKSHANWVVEYMGLRNWMENARKFSSPRSAAGNPTNQGSSYTTQPSSAAALHKPVPMTGFEDQRAKDKAAWKAAREKGFA